MCPTIKLKWPSLALAMLVVTAAVTPVHAALLNVQILGRGDDQHGGPDAEPPAYQGAGVIGADRDYWNGVRADSFGQPLTVVSPEPILAADGRTTTSVTLAFADFIGADYWPPAQGAPVQNNLMNAYLVCRPRASVTIDGLIPNAPYDLYLFGNNSHAGAGAKFNVNGTSQSTEGSGGPVFTKGVDYAEFQGVRADKDGALVITVEASQGGLGVFNGFQLHGEFAWSAVLTTGPDSRRRPLVDLGSVVDQRAKLITDPMISFVYDGRHSAELLAQWKSHRESRRLDAQRTEYTATWTDPRTGLEVRVVGIEYGDYPAVEWTAYFKNAGASNTPILKNVQALDVIFERADGDEFILHGNKGDSCTADSYEPYHLPLGANALKNCAPPGHSGKSCDGPNGWPYYNLQVPGGGVILAVGWPGQWAGWFRRDAAKGLNVTAGQEVTRLYLKPGEEIRTPLIALLFWQGTDVVTAQNLWRRWYVAHNMPRVDGKTQPAVAQIQVGGGEKDLAYVQSFLDAGIHVDLCWRDAGGFRENVWFQAGEGPFKEPGMIWLNSGTWEIDTAKYPNGFKPFTDWIHARNMQFVLWFEPERVGDPNSWLGKNHPEWLLPGTSHGALLDEGNPEARAWLTKHVSGMISSQGIDWYREDMNGGGPLPAWRRHDAQDRQGMTENLYVQGHLAFWDSLRRRHPGLRIDSCASGGRRNDLETMRRAVPLLRSDFQFPNMPGVIEGNQGHTYGLSFWLPFQGTGCYLDEPYAYRSFYLPSFGMGRLNAENTAAQQKAYAECRQVAPRMLADYYPLTPYSRELNRWIAWQFNRPEQGDGVVQAFRRPQCAEEAAHYRLRGLDPQARYAVTDLDSGQAQTLTGRELMDDGLPVAIPAQPGASILTYTRLK